MPSITSAESLGAAPAEEDSAAIVAIRSRRVIERNPVIRSVAFPGCHAHIPGGIAAWKGYATDYGVPLDDSTTSYGDNGRAILFGWRRPQALGAGDRRHEQSRLGGGHARHPEHPGRFRTVHGHGLHVAGKAGFQPLRCGDQ